MAEKKVSVIDVLNVIGDAGETPMQAKEIREQLNLSGATLSRHLQMLLDGGWARKMRNGGYLVGPQHDHVSARRREDNAAQAKRLHDVMQSMDPEPPEGGRTDGEVFLLLRCVDEMRREAKEFRADIKKLLQERQGQGSAIERIGG